MRSLIKIRQYMDKKMKPFEPFTCSIFRAIILIQMFHGGSMEHDITWWA